MKWPMTFCQIHTISSDPINMDWSLAYRLMCILEIRCRGSTVAELSKLTYVED